MLVRCNVTTDVFDFLEGLVVRNHPQCGHIFVSLTVTFNRVVVQSGIDLLKSARHSNPAHEDVYCMLASASTPLKLDREAVFRCQIIAWLKREVCATCIRNNNKVYALKTGFGL